ncbi:MAG: hypothetical protein AABW87_01460, partial [Nanoarchaeota archaeon]
EHRLWLELADNDQGRLAKYVESTFRQGKDRFDYDEMLGFYISEDRKPIVRGLIFYRLENRSDAVGGGLLDTYSTRLVGVRDEVAPKNPQ